MKKMTVIISLIAIICLISGGYALISSDNGNINDVDNVVVSDEVKDNIISSELLDISQNNELFSIFDKEISKEIFTASLNNVLNPSIISKESNEEINLNNYFPYGDPVFTDRYSQCVCGKFFPLGPVTDPIPDWAICSEDTCPENRTMDPDYKMDIWYYYSYSAEEAIYIVNHHTLEGFSGNTTPRIFEPMTVLYENPNYNNQLYIFSYDTYDFTDRYIQCVECGGFLPLGEVTKELGENTLCHNFGGSGFVGEWNTVSYEKACELIEDNLHGNPSFYNQDIDPHYYNGDSYHEAENLEEQYLVDESSIDDIEIHEGEIVIDNVVFY